MKPMSENRQHETAEAIALGVVMLNNKEKIKS